jgi:hypothetical protein
MAVLPETPSAKTPAQQVLEEKQTVAQQILSRIGIKPTAASVSKLVAWFDQEGGNWENSAKYNPLNTTLAEPGAGNTGSQGNIKVYTSWEQGVEATVKTLQAPAYKTILATLASGTGTAFEDAVNASPWGTKFPGNGNAVGHSKPAGYENVIGGILPGPEQALSEAVSNPFGFSWEKLGEFALTSMLLLVGAVLVVYGIMVAVKPRGSGMPMPVPVPV